MVKTTTYKTVQNPREHIFKLMRKAQADRIKAEKTAVLTPEDLARANVVADTINRQWERGTRPVRRGIVRDFRKNRSTFANAVFTGLLPCIQEKVTSTKAVRQ